VARFSPGSLVQGRVGDASVSADLIAMVAGNPRSGNFVSMVPLDGEARTTSYRALDTWPFIVYAGVSNERFFMPWRQQALIVVLLAMSVSMLIMAATWLVDRANRRGDGAIRALADQSKRIQALLRTAGDGIHITDSQGRLVEMSDSFAQMLKSSRERLLGRHISSWDANQDQAAITAWLAKFKPGDRKRVDVQHRRDDGQLIDVELQLSAVEIGGDMFVFSSARDVSTERRLMREQAAMLNNDVVGMVKIEKRVITWQNRAVERILGYASGELKGQPARLVYWDDAQYERVGTEGYAALREHGHYRSHVRLRRKSGESVWVDFGAVPLTDLETFTMIVDVTAMKLAHEDMVHAAFHDALTQLPNRLLLHDRIDQALATARRDGKSVAVCYLDLDGFKEVNDLHGHDAGDTLLQAVAHRLRSAIRPSDTAARVGGDEFVLVLGSVSDGEWRPVLERVMESIGEPVALGFETAVSVAATAGVTVCHTDDVAGAQELVQRADHVMLRGKRSGKGGVFLH
jgi:diguanylate cyclase (GGDEF)-like protein/PAS domain S-box-containing protein